MKSVFRVLLAILSYAPIATVAIAAQAKASEVDGESQNQILIKNLQAARYRVVPMGPGDITHEDSKKRYADLTGLTGDELEANRNEDINLLVNHGLIQINEKGLVTMGPSMYAAK